jgi:hypothetical protein
MPANPFNKDLYEITFADIEKLRDTARAESEILEYKGEMPNRLDLQKEVLGFANNIGGFLVIGVKAKRPENTIEAIDGIDKEANIQEKIVSIVRDHSSPQFVPRVHLIDKPSDSTRCIIIVFSHESETVHRASDGRYYYRTENQTIPIRPEFVSKIIGKEKIKEQLDKIIDDFHLYELPIGKGMSRTVYDNGWFTAISIPIPPENLKISLFSEIEWYITAGINAISGAGNYDRRSTTNSLRVFKVGADHSPNALVEYFENGIILYCRSLFSFTKSINERGIIDNLDDFLNFLVKVYDKNSFEGGLLIIVWLGNINEWTWTLGDPLENDKYDISPSSQQFLTGRYETTVSALKSDTSNLIKLIVTQFRRNFNIH